MQKVDAGARLRAPQVVRHFEHARLFRRPSVQSGPQGCRWIDEEGADRRDHQLERARRQGHADPPGHRRRRRRRHRPPSKPRCSTANRPRAEHPLREDGRYSSCRIVEQERNALGFAQLALAHQKGIAGDRHREAGRADAQPYYASASRRRRCRPSSRPLGRGRKDHVSVNDRARAENGAFVSRRWREHCGEALLLCLPGAAGGRLAVDRLDLFLPHHGKRGAASLRRQLPRRAELDASRTAARQPSPHRREHAAGGRSRQASGGPQRARADQGTAVGADRGHRVEAERSIRARWKAASPRACRRCSRPPSRSRSTPTNSRRTRRSSRPTTTPHIANGIERLIKSYRDSACKEAQDAIAFVSATATSLAVWVLLSRASRRSC